MGKRILTVLAVVCMLAAPFCVNADVVFDNDFLRQNKDKTQELDRKRFCVSSPDGYVVLRETPGWDGEIIQYETGAPKYENGAELHMGNVCIVGGEYWGIPVIGHYSWIPGWIPMEYLRVLYIAADFNNEHIGEFYQYSGSYAAAENAKKLVVWQWPGSDREKIVIEDDFALRADSAIYAYKDGEGRQWVYLEIEYGTSYVSWYQGYSGMWSEYGWICVSDPENSGIPAFNPAPEPAVWVPRGGFWADSVTPEDGGDIAGIANPANTNKNYLIQTIVIIAAASLAVITAAFFLIKILSKKPRR